MNAAIGNATERGPRTVARAVTAAVQARAIAGRVRDELVVAADIVSECSEDELRAIGDQDRDDLLRRYRAAIVMLDDVERGLVW